MQQIKISIVTVVYNAVKTLEATIKSVLKKRDNRVEYIIIDGGSTDGTIDIIKKYVNELAFWCSEPDKGIYDAMNKSFQYLKGDWVLFMGSDDVLYRPMNEYSGLFTNSDVIYHGDVLLSPQNKVYGGEFSKLMIARRNICQQAIFYPKSALMKYPFELRYKTFADYDLNIKCFSDARYRFQYIPFIIAKYNSLGMSSSFKDKAFHADFYGMIYRRLGLASLIYGFVWKNLYRVKTYLLPEANN